MSRRNILVSAVIFLLLTAIKLGIPGGALFLRTQSERILDHDTDYATLFRAAKGRFRQPREETSPAVESRYPVFAQQNTGRFALRSLRQSLPGRVPAETQTEKVKRLRQPPVPDEAVMAVEAEEEPEAPLPAAVETFLSSQAAFADYAMPANVTYDMPTLPFSYSTPVSGYESSGFGYRLHPILNEVRFHYGTDLAAWTGETVTAFADGTVSFAGYSDSYGNYITISHEDGWQSLYAHCSRLLVSSGDHVTQGQAIAQVGATGLATGPHLHFELTQNGIYANPEYYVNY